MKSDLVFDVIVNASKANAYDIVKVHNQELREIRDHLIEALELAMRQLEDPDEDIRSIRDNAAWAIERARRV